MSEVTKELSSRLTYKNKTVYEAAPADEVAKAFAFAEPYKKYLDDAKTEREAVTAAIKIAEAEGFVPYALGDALTVGGKYYYNNRG
ncbi:MAG: aminopeptidase, partial [Clostridia bacterium]|nr:aminopeptidase [Clostridia bacterium]